MTTVSDKPKIGAILPYFGGKRNLQTLSLGAGVQSTVLYLWACDGTIEFDAAIFADTGDEPRYVYEHLDWLESLGGPPIFRRSLGVHLSVSLVAGLNSTGQRFVSIPAHTTGRKNGLQRRQCTQEFKLRVIEQSIRRDLFGLEPGRPIPSDASITQLIGFSTDEGARAVRTKSRPRARGWGVEFPLIDAGLSRNDCEKYCRQHIPHEVGRSACVYCPYRSNHEWRELKRRDPAGWDKAVRVDAALRDTEASYCTRGMVSAMYVHRSRMPLNEAPITERENHPLFFQDCEGGCGL